MKNEIMYNINSILLVTMLFIAILLFYELGFRIGKNKQEATDKEIKEQTSAIQAGILGLLALLLGFTFNMALQRFDNRSQAEIKEANAIGTAMLRTKLLPAPFDTSAAQLMEQYIDLRLLISGIDLTHPNQRREYNQKTDKLLDELWRMAGKAAEVDPSPVVTGYFINSLNDMIDARGERNAILKRHIPEAILILLFIVFMLSGAIIGYSSGLSLKRAYVPTVIMTLLIVLVVFITIDLDRPKRGIIKVKQDSMLELKHNK
jgi:RsiW-degrading membrane proteinase PrsW (M82 family)